MNEFIEVVFYHGEHNLSHKMAIRRSDIKHFKELPESESQAEIRLFNGDRIITIESYEEVKKLLMSGANK